MLYADPPAFSSVRVLLIDSHNRYADQLDEQVAVVGHARNHHEGVAMALQLQPQVILVNCQHDLNDGVARVVHITQRAAHIPVVALAAEDSDTPYFVEAAFNAGATCVFTLPLPDPQMFYDTLMMLAQ